MIQEHVEFMKSNLISNEIAFLYLCIKFSYKVSYSQSLEYLEGNTKNKME